MSELPSFFSRTDSALHLAAKAAMLAGEVIRDNYQLTHEIEQKAAGDLVSRVDFEADQRAANVLRQDPDQLPILSEELSPETDDPSQDMWIVDPLDGTTAYLMAAGPQFPSVLVAKRVARETAIGVTYFPLRDDWFYAIKGQGAFKNGKRLLMTRDNMRLDEAWIEMNQYGDSRFETDFFAAARTMLRMPNAARIVTSSLPHAGVAMRVAEQASGLSAAIHDNNPASLKQGPWDIAACQLIFEEAGGVFVNPDGERTSPFCAEPIIIAPTRHLALEIIDTCVSRAASQ